VTLKLQQFSTQSRSRDYCEGEFWRATIWFEDKDDYNQFGTLLCNRANLQIPINRLTQEIQQMEKREEKLGELATPLAF